MDGAFNSEEWKYLDLTQKHRKTTSSLLNLVSTDWFRWYYLVPTVCGEVEHVLGKQQQQNNL